MKDIKTYLEDLMSTPANTIGMGGISAPGPNGELGSGDIPQPVCNDIKNGKSYKRRKRFRRYKI